MDADGWIFYYNQRWYDYTGTTSSEMEGWGWVNVHDPRDLPLILAGGAAGTLPKGRHIRFKKGSELPNLYVTMLEKLGVPERAVGDSTGSLAI